MDDSPASPVPRSHVSARRSRRPAAPSRSSAPRSPARPGSLRALFVHGDMVMTMVLIVALALLGLAAVCVALGMQAVLDPLSIQTELNLYFGISTAIVAAGLIGVAAARRWRSRKLSTTHRPRGLAAALVFSGALLAAALVLFAIVAVIGTAAPAPDGGGMLGVIAVVSLYLMIPVAVAGLLGLVTTGVLALIRGAAHTPS